MSLLFGVILLFLVMAVVLLFTVFVGVVFLGIGVYVYDRIKESIVLGTFL